MARFYADIEGSRGPASRQGSEKSGIYSHARGWDIGASVVCYVNDDGEDVVRVCITSGSNGLKPSKVIFEGSTVPTMSLADTAIRMLDMSGYLKEGVVTIPPEKLKEILNNTGYR